MLKATIDVKFFLLDKMEIRIGDDARPSQPLYRRVALKGKLFPSENVESFQREVVSGGGSQVYKESYFGMNVPLAPYTLVTT